MTRKASLDWTAREPSPRGRRCRRQATRPTEASGAGSWVAWLPPEVEGRDDSIERRSHGLVAGRSSDRGHEGFRIEARVVRPGVELTGREGERRTVDTVKPLLGNEVRRRELAELGEGSALGVLMDVIPNNRRGRRLGDLVDGVFVRIEVEAATGGSDRPRAAQLIDAVHNFIAAFEIDEAEQAKPVADHDRVRDRTGHARRLRAEV